MHTHTNLELKLLNKSWAGLSIIIYRQLAPLHQTSSYVHWLKPARRRYRRPFALFDSKPERSRPRFYSEILARLPLSLQLYSAHQKYLHLALLCQLSPAAAYINSCNSTTPHLTTSHIISAGPRLHPCPRFVPSHQQDLAIECTRFEPCTRCSTV